MSANIYITDLRGREIKCKTKPGVFSKEGLDSGSKLLIDKMEVMDGTLLADMGCGVGVIGFGAAILNPRGHVHLLDDNLRVINLAKENTQLNGFRNVEVYLSDLFSAVKDRTYHQIFSNPPQHLGNEFLEEAILETFKHLKPEGKVTWVIQRHLRKIIEEMFKKYFSNCTIVTANNEHIVLLAEKRR